MFMVFTTAAFDEHKSIVLLAFEITERIVQDYFPYIIETDTTAFTDCVNCLIAFTNSKSKEDISLSAIGFLRLCAAKRAEGDTSFSRNKEKDDSKILGLPHQTQSPCQTQSPHQRSPRQGSNRKYEIREWVDQKDRLLFWLPLLAG